MPYLQRGHRRIFYEDTGSGGAILLGHSFFCSGEMWREQVPALARSHRVINVDLRGHGRSSPVRESLDLYDLVDDALALLDHLKIERAIWAGLSVGGMIALPAALDFPARVGALILLDTDAERSWIKIKHRSMGTATRLVGLRSFTAERGEDPDADPIDHDVLVPNWKDDFLDNGPLTTPTRAQGAHWAVIKQPVSDSQDFGYGSESDTLSAGWQCATSRGVAVGGRKRGQVCASVWRCCWF
jgi:pimeloyl-ACP methyl ester carboxylesterase